MNQQDAEFVAKVLSGYNTKFYWPGNSACGYYGISDEMVNMHGVPTGYEYYGIYLILMPEFYDDFRFDKNQAFAFLKMVADTVTPVNNRFLDTPAKAMAAYFAPGVMQKALDAARDKLLKFPGNNTPQYISSLLFAQLHKATTDEDMMVRLLALKQSYLLTFAKISL